MGLLLLLLLTNAATGFVLNREIQGTMTPGPTRAIALAASRAAFYAPSLVEVGHGVHTPLPLLLVLALANPDFLTFLLPGLVFLVSLALDLSKKQRR